MQKSDRPSPITTVLDDLDANPCEHLQLALPTRHLGREWGNLSCQRFPPSHSSLLAKNGIGRPAAAKTARTTRSKPSDTTIAKMSRLQQNLRNSGNSGST